MQSCGTQDVGLNCFGPATAEALVVEAAKSGDHSAFEELWARHSRTAFTLVYRIIGNRDDAEDTLQDAWMKAFVHLKTFDGRSKFSTWLARIAINTALMVLRRKRVRQETSMDWTEDGETWQGWEIPDDRLNGEDLLLKKEAELTLKEAIERLQPPLRTIMEIQCLHYRSNQEVADVAGISLAAAKSRAFRAKARLRRSLRASMSATQPRKNDR
jgi:RNA polymerase sigma-70 factor (ECF subfamily)